MKERKNTNSESNKIKGAVDDNCREKDEVGWEGNGQRMNPRVDEVTFDELNTGECAADAVDWE
jgi:hypothetical protein